MSTQLARRLLFATAAILTASSPAWSQAYNFSTGNPDGLIATASRPGSPGHVEIESADDFVLDSATQLTNGTFTGLIPANADVTDIGGVVLEIYRVFPADSVLPPSGHVPTRTNSPSDVALDFWDSTLGEVAITTSTLASNFSAGNSVINGINPAPNPYTGGEGPVSGQEVRFAFSFSTPVDLPAGHYFFVPQVQLQSGDFLWLSAPHPIVSPGTPFSPDLQSWIRNGNLSPDWLRIGTDITQQGPFNAAFSLEGLVVPEPGSWAMMLIGLAGIGVALRRRRRERPAAI